jgi:four helix bundle protein
MTRKLEELPIHRKAVEFCSSVTALLDRPAFGRNRKLHDQIDSANDSILSNMSEGFEQPTDRAVEKYLFDAKGSAAEVLARLETAQRKGCMTSEELARCKAMGGELLGMLGGWIKYLARCDWKDRGRHRPQARDPIQDKDSG